MKKTVTSFIFSVIFLSLSAQQAKPSTGSIRHLENFSSRFVGGRNIDIWLPEGYSNKNKYAVLYMHDGQMLFDSSINWNKQEWGVDETLGKLLATKKIKDCIVVGIWNTGKGRHSDYLPQKPFETLSSQQQDSIYFSQRTNGASVFNNVKVHSDNYLKFLVTELKPFIDSSFSTLKEQKSTFIAGSSMGGLISLYAICEYPNVFGGAACLSTHWPGIFTTVDNPLPGAFLQYLKTHLPSPSSHAFYFDYGSATLDSMYKPYQLKADAVMKQQGYTAKNWMTKEFIGQDHSEASWRKRFAVPLIFLLGEK